MARRSILPVFIPHLGCPNNCVFCDQHRISGSQRPACAQDVTDILQSARERGEHDAELAYYGGSFTAVEPCLQEELLGAAQPYRTDGTITAIRLSTRPDAIDETVTARLARYRVDTVELGVQSMDDRVLYESGRGHTAADTENAVRLLKTAGFHVILQMMTGLPGSSMQSDIETAKKIIALRPDGMRVYPTVIVRGTPLEDLWRAGQYCEHTVADAVQVCAEILPLTQQAGIPVIRLGLNPTQELSGGAAVAGAYHPAFGELVRSEILLRQARQCIGQSDPQPGEKVTLTVSPRDYSAMIGQHRQNITQLVQEYALGGLKILSDPTVENGVRVN